MTGERLVVRLFSMHIDEITYRLEREKGDTQWKHPSFNLPTPNCIRDDLMRDQFRDEIRILEEAKHENVEGQTHASQEFSPKAFRFVDANGCGVVDENGNHQYPDQVLCNPEVQCQAEYHQQTFSNRSMSVQECPNC